MPQLPGLIKGLGVTGKTALRTLFPKRGWRTLIPAPQKGAVTVQYPHEKEAPPDRARGVIALHEENCTACMLCSRSCPDWCIYIEGHKVKAPPRRAGGKARTVNFIDRFDIDYALCMYCGICVEVCPFDALFWTPEYEYSEPSIADLLHDRIRLGEWMETVPAFGAYEPGSEQKVLDVPSFGPDDMAPVRKLGADDAVPVGELGADDAVPVRELGADDAVPVGELGADDAVPVGELGADDAVPVAAEADGTGLPG